MKDKIIYGFIILLILAVIIAFGVWGWQYAASKN